jgi:hypothetical protein
LTEESRWFKGSRKVVSRARKVMEGNASLTPGGWPTRTSTLRFLRHARLHSFAAMRQEQRRFRRRMLRRGCSACLCLAHIASWHQGGASHIAHHHTSHRRRGCVDGDEVCSPYRADMASLEEEAMRKMCRVAPLQFQMVKP